MIYNNLEVYPFISSSLVPMNQVIEYHRNEFLHLPLASLQQGVPAIVVAIAYNSHPELQKFQGISITYSHGFIKFSPQ